MYKLYNSFQRFIAVNLVNIVILLLAKSALDFLESFPYLNTFLAFPYRWNSFLLLFILAVILFKLTEVFSFGLAFIFFGLAALLSIFGKNTVSQSVGIVVYSLIWFGLVQMGIRFWRTSKNK